MLKSFGQKAMAHATEQLLKEQDFIKNNYEVAGMTTDKDYITVVCRNGHSGHLFYHYQIKDDALFYVADEGYIEVKESQTL